MTRAAVGADIEARSATWQFVPGGEAPAGITVPYAVIGGEADKLLLTGLGERDVMGIAERLAEQGVSGLAVASLVYPAVPGRLTGAAVEQSIVKGTETLVHDITGNGHGIQQAIGNSEGANQILMAASQKPGLYGQVVAIAPLINNGALGETPKAQARTLLGRFGEAGLKIGDNGGFNRELMQEIMGGLAYADERDPREIVAALGSKLRIYVGEDDVVVPPAEAEAEVGTDAVTRVAGMGHPTLLDEEGSRQVARIMQVEWTAGIVK